MDLYPLPSFNQFSIHEWTKLKEGDNLYDALTYAINHTDWIPDGPHYNYFLAHKSRKKAF